MNTILAFTSIIVAIISAAYLQLPTFLLGLGYKWFHNYKSKRWLMRLVALILYLIFLFRNPSLSLILFTSIPFLFFWLFSLFNANPKIYIALSENQILKQKDFVYSKETEILGFIDSKEQSIAYPILEMIKPRHLLNDVFNNNPILVSYCMACRSAMVYNPIVNGVHLTFDVLGVYRRNMVMVDRETGTIWQQATGEAVCGKLKGIKLEILPYQITNLESWLNLKPESFIAVESNLVKDGIFSKERLMKMMKITEKLVAPGLTNLDGLPLREKVFGIEIEVYSRAYPVSELIKENNFKDKIGETILEINYSPTNNIIKIVNKNNNQIIASQSHWWFGWKEFHPNTTIWNSKKVI